MPFGTPTYYFETLPSTNEYALELLAQEELPEGTIIETAYQTKGRGQKNRTWYSQPNVNITLSVILHPTWLAIESQFLLNLMAALSIVKTIEITINKSAQVKWPNDVYVDAKKISGILIKNQLQGGSIQNSIVGIGLNVLQSEWPEDVISATSLINESQQSLRIDKVKFTLLSQLEKYYFLIQTDQQAVIDAYNQYLYKKDEAVVFHYQGQVQNGIVRSIDHLGRLLIEMEGSIRPFGLGEITFHNT